VTARTVRTKICGLTVGADAHTADAAGADYLGVVVSDGFRRSVAAERATHVLAGTKATGVAVLVDETPDEAEIRARRSGAAVLQLHGDEPVEVVAELRDRGDWTIWKAVRARVPEDVTAAVDRDGRWVDGILVEGWKDGVVGGGGVRLRLAPDRVREAIPRELDFILAGGLDETNVAEAVALFVPDVVDVSSGTEGEPGRKDPARLRAFLAAVAGAARAPNDGDAEPPRARIG
jgi:phosphoribosylanthranilate isomerase